MVGRETWRSFDWGFTNEWLQLPCTSTDGICACDLGLGMTRVLLDKSKIYERKDNESKTCMFLSFYHENACMYLAILTRRQKCLGNRTFSSINPSDLKAKMEDDHVRLDFRPPHLVYSIVLMNLSV